MNQAHMFLWQNLTIQSHDDENVPFHHQFLEKIVKKILEGMSREMGREWSIQEAGEAGLLDAPRSSHLETHTFQCLTHNFERNV